MQLKLIKELFHFNYKINIIISQMKASANNTEAIMQ
jgi:hypothetical protein